MKGTDGNADMVWPQVGLPKHRRSACRAKMHPDLSPLLPVADIDVGRSFGANMFLLVEGTNAEHRTGSPLTLATMAGAYNIRIGGYPEHHNAHPGKALPLSLSCLDGNHGLSSFSAPF
jgi:hypothetical protein